MFKDSHFEQFSHEFEGLQTKLFGQVDDLNVIAHEDCPATVPRLEQISRG